MPFLGYIAVLRVARGEWLHFAPRALHCIPQATGAGHDFYWNRLYPMSETPEYKSWMCLICGYIYHEETGAPDDGIPPGTRWDDVPINWTCPDCGARKEDFEMVAF
jgi:rubredoxin